MIPQEKKKKEPEDDIVTRIQKYGQAEMEKNRKAEEEKRKNKGKVDTAPSKGILSRIYEFATGIKEPEKTEEDKKKKK